MEPPAGLREQGPGAGADTDPPPEGPGPATGPGGVRARLYEVLMDEDGDTSTAARLVRGIIVGCIIASVIATVLASAPSTDARLRVLFLATEYLAAAVFSAEYVARLWVVVEDRGGRFTHPLWGRLRYAVTPGALIDLVAVLPFYLEVFGSHDLLILRLLRVLRILKLSRYSKTLATFEVILINERSSLGIAAAMMGVLLLIAASLMHVAEGNAQPEAFGSIPLALWWAVVTLTTVGYGDVVPVTSLGRLIAGAVSVMGIAMFALPTAILGAGLMQELQKRSFALTASMVGRVPLFRKLSPDKLAELTALLRPRELPAGYTLIRRGERASSMYFLVEGEVLVRHGRRQRRLRPGAFFGAVALLEGRPRVATVTTLTSCRVLELAAIDFHRLMSGDAELRAAILGEAKKRLASFGGE